MLCDVRHRPGIAAGITSPSNIRLKIASRAGATTEAAIIDAARQHLTEDAVKLLRKEAVEYLGEGEAAELLQELGHEPCNPTKAELIDAANRLLKVQSNDSDNLWAGKANENRKRGAQFSAAYRKAIDAPRNGDMKAHNEALSIVRVLWHDPDPTGEKKGFVKRIPELIRLLRDAFKAKWPNR